MLQKRLTFNPRLLLFLLFAALAITMMFVHKPWRDEAQAWQLVRTLSLPALFGQLHYEGHPALWYLLLWPLVRLGFGYFSMFVLHTLLVLACGWLIVFRSPFSLPMQAMILFGFTIGYMNNVFARSYILIVLLVFLIAWIFPRRYRSMRFTFGYAGLLTLLINVHLLGACFAAVLMLYDFLLLLYRLRRRENFRTYLRGFGCVFLFFAAGMLLMYLTLRGDRYFYGAQRITLSMFLHANYPSILLHIFQSGVVMPPLDPVNSAVITLTTTSRAVYLFVQYGSKLILALAFVAVLRRFKTTVFMLLFCAGYALLYVAGVPANEWNIVNVTVVLIFGMWVSRTARDEFRSVSETWDGVVAKIRIRSVSIPAVCVVLFFLFGVVSGAAYDIQEMQRPYSMASSAAQFVKQEGYDTGRTVLITPNIAESVSLLPYLRGIRGLTLPGWSGIVSFSPWNSAYEKYDPTDRQIFDFARAQYSASGKTPLVIYQATPKTVPSDFVLIYTGLYHNAVELSEQYSIYTLRQLAPKSQYLSPVELVKEIKQ